MSRDTLSAMKKGDSVKKPTEETLSSQGNRVLRSCRAGSPERADMSKIIALIKRENQRSQMEVLREERRILGWDRNHSMSADKFEKLSSFSMSRRSS